MLFSYKFFTFSQPFSQFPNKFYITKATTTHTPTPIENPPLFTQNPPPHNTETTKTPPPTPPQQQQPKKKKKIKDQREKADRQRDRPRGGDRSASGGRRDRPKGGDDLTRRRTRPIKRQQASCGAISARSRRRVWLREVKGSLSLSLSLSLSAHLSTEMV